MTAAQKKTIVPENGIAIRVIGCLLSLSAIATSFVFGRSPVPTINFSLTDLSLLIMSAWLCIGGCMLSYHYRANFPQPMKTLLNIGAVTIALNLARELWVTNVNADQFDFANPLMNTLIATMVISSFELRSRNDLLVTATFGLSLMALSGFSGRSMLFAAAVLLYILLGAVLLLLAARSSSSSAQVADHRLVSANCRGRYRPALIAAVLLLPLSSLAAFSFVPRLDQIMDNLVISTRTLMTEVIYKARSDRTLGQLPVGMRKDKSLTSPNLKAHNPNDFKEHGSWKPKLAPEAKPEPAAATKPKPAAVIKPKPVLQTKPKPAAKTKTKPASQEGPKPALPAKTGTQQKSSAKPGTISPPKAERSSAPPQGEKPALPSRPNVADKHQQPAANSTPSQAQAPPPAPQPNRKTKVQDKQISKPATRAEAPTNLPARTSNPQKTIKSAPPPQSAQQPTRASAKKTGVSSKPPSTKSLDTASVRIDVPVSESNELLMTLSCNRNVYLRTTTFDTFDGQSWTRNNKSAPLMLNPTERGIDATRARALQVSAALPVMELTEKITFKSLTTTAVPVGGIAKQISLITNVSVDDNGNIESLAPLPPGQTYTAICDWPVFSLPTMRKAESLADTNDDLLSAYLKLPANESREMILLSQQLVANGSNRFQQAESIVSYLREHCKYGTQSAQSDGTVNLADKFVFDTKAGDCKSFATAFCMLCRAAGIPSRYVAGFIPGDFDPVTGTTLIRSKHTHAWAEIYMEPYGWIPFDPTPGGMLPARPEQKYYNYKEIRRQTQQYAATTGKRVALTVVSVFRYLALLIYAAGILIAVVLVGYTISMLRGLLKHMREQRLRFHPAHALRRRVLKKLRRLGLVENSADTGADIIRRLQETLAEKPQTSGLDAAALTQNVQEFFTTYNALVFGKTGDIKSLKTLTLSIESQFRRN
jgi:hypothetical protein